LSRRLPECAPDVCLTRSDKTDYINALVAKRGRAGNRTEHIMSELDLVVSIALGVGLAAATGLRLFVPMLVASTAAYSGYLPLSEGFAWLATPAALTMLGVAALVEILAYYIPGIDNVLDALTTPAAFVAGIVVSAAVMADVPPLVKWTTAVIAGGGAAGLAHGTTAMLRAGSTLVTGGLGNPVIATAELGGALLLSLLALAAPIAAVVAVAVLAWQVRKAFRKSGTSPPA
jgi:hypothetical protein